MKSIPHLTLALLSAAGSAALADVDTAKLPPVSQKKGVTYAGDIRAIFEATCFRCHGDEKQKGELRLDSLEAVLKGGKDGPDVVPGNSVKSPLVIAVAQLDPDTAMPPKGGRRPDGHGPGGPGGPGPGGHGPDNPGAPRGPGPDGPGIPPGAGGPAPDGHGAGFPGDPAGRGGPQDPSRPGYGGAGPGARGPAPKPLTAEQVGLIRAWIDQGAK